MAKTVTVTNPVTGQPAQVDQLDHTAQQIDDAILKVKYLTGRNLLDNAYWASPDAIIDQRGGYIQIGGTMMYKDPDFTEVFGASSGTTPVRIYGSYARPIDNGAELGLYIKPSDCVRGYTGAGYGPDRWRLFGNTITCRITPDGLTLTSSGENSVLECFLDTDLTGKTVTMSALIDGIVYSGSKTVDQYDFAGAVQFPGGTIRAFYADGKSFFRIWLSNVAGTTVQLKAVKLELGSQQTLAHQDENGNWVLNDPPPDKALELLKCQRYYQLYSSADKRPAKAVDCRPMMRADPVQGTINIDGVTYYYNNAEL